jgi:hypothetical protein
MYRRPKFLELLLEIRREMAHEADYDVDLYVENVRHGPPAPPQPKSLADAETAAAPALNGRRKRMSHARRT